MNDHDTKLLCKLAQDKGRLRYLLGEAVRILSAQRLLMEDVALVEQMRKALAETEL